MTLRQWSLWDLLPASIRPSPVVREDRRPPARGPAPAKVARATRNAGRATMQDRYESMARELLAAHGVRVRRWRTSMSGVAWEVRYNDGTVKRLIEAPQPRGPMSAAVFLHEIGHHAIGFNRYSPRCLEEHMAWSWALAEMERRSLNITPAVRKRVLHSMRYAIAKARRRGIKEIPGELHAYLPPAERS